MGSFVKSNTYLKIFLLALTAGLYSCKNLLTYSAKNAKHIEFSGYQWEIKTGNYRQGPGDNFFSNHRDNIRLDWRGHLHLNITQRDSLWHSVEIIAVENMTYGRYEFQIEGPLSELDPYSVLGLFTWDPKSFSEQANSEIDIEFSKWGYPLSPHLLYYSVHPVAQSGKLNLERMYRSPLGADSWNGISTHVIEWRDSSVNWSSYLGKKAELKNRSDYFHYSFSNKKRSKEVSGTNSAAITVPQPGEKTSARINYWLMNKHNAPLKEDCPEIIIRKFSYQPF